MATLLQGCEQYCVPYLDDVAIVSDTWQDHMRHLNEILCKIGSAKLKIKPVKCKFAQDCVKYFGHMLGRVCRSPAEAIIQAVLDFPTPRSKTEIRKILGMIAYYSRYIENYAMLVEPLTRALKGKTRKESIEWTEEMEKALEKKKVN
ncbi:Transposon Ty3-I Gag-Pol polyprotein [Araneus ventricosus]|uniref:Transposon Ty3-I Gag-Pol polyprotein n=1 Tax=Araneus ventricosus TaxID=182803 RepID=A0A4Y2V1S0_ARAVE|nr:Transposon Ty3-I Gag-Pol polyprotein [Araneus ventricosus]GBO18334.1 Transposon Ty3-I Gag-Pol polyprotein [Araneus ventricosus]